MPTLELKKIYHSLYSASTKKVDIVDVPALPFLMIDGAIEPGQAPGTSPGFQAAVQALYGIAYTLKFNSKKHPDNPIDYPVMALEGLWWVRDGRFKITIKDNWDYTLMILQPDHINSEMFTTALAQLRRKKGDQPAFAGLRLETFEEGRCVQTMHLGAYADEPATVARMDDFMQAHQLTPHGKHHEIYLGDPLRSAVERLKTILRHPVTGRAD